MTTDPHLDELDDHDDDHDRGLQFDMSTLFDRRRLLALFAGAGATALLVACGSGDDDAATASTSGGTSGTTATTAAPGTATAATAATAATDTSCSPIPEETAGPYPGDGSNGVNVLAESGIARRDITSSFGTSTTRAEGIPLTITLTLTDTANGCAPMAGAAVYLWHCDRDGNYSMYSPAVADENYLRGVQETAAAGTVTFETIFPACYSGRWPHVHFEVYRASATPSSDLVATSQLALPAETCDLVYATSGYEASVRNLGQVSLARDNVFGDDGAAHQLATMSGDVDTGFVAALAVAV
ncbi:MAG: 3,4-dioxygenase subunit beta [Ilumatobacteraceae bacterium]